MGYKVHKGTGVISSEGGRKEGRKQGRREVEREGQKNENNLNGYQLLSPHIALDFRNKAQTKGEQ